MTTETPPCTWRKSPLNLKQTIVLGNTSMHMEKIVARVM